MLRLFEKKKKQVFVDVSQKYFIGDKNVGVETEWRRLGEVARGAETVVQGLEDILHIIRPPKVISQGSWQPYTPSLVYVKLRPS